MHHPLVLTIFSSTFLVLTTLSGTTGDSGPQLLSDDNSLLKGEPQPQSLTPEDIEAEKRSWNDLQNGWGKRGWKDLHSTGWGKRSWGDLRNGWGKRDLLDSPEAFDKRAWSDLKSASWGKRDWSQFRGGWGKRYAFDDQLNPGNFEDEDDLFGYDKSGFNSKDQFAMRNGIGSRQTKKSGSKWGRLNGAWG